MAKAQFDYYRIGIQELLGAIGPDDPFYVDVLVFQQRLEENLTAADRFGETPSLQAERAQIIDRCNRLGLSATGHSFYYFCGLPEPPRLPRTRADELLREAIRRQLEGDLGYALQLYRQV